MNHSTLFTTCSLLLRELLAPKWNLRWLRRIEPLESSQGLIIDDLGDVRQSRQEMEVLLTLSAARYEQVSLLTSSNSAFRE